MLSRTAKRFLDPGVIARLENISLQARFVVEGFMIGLHKSPYHGFSVEFSEHRPYMPGDELKYLDWKIFGKTDRYFIKQFEEETNLRCYLLLDASNSMNFKSDPVSKLEYASFLVAALSYLMLKQQDAFSLTIFDNSIRKFLPPRTTPTHLNSLLVELEQLKPGGETSIAPILHTTARKLRKRGLIILVSDLLDEPAEVLKGLKHFRHKGHEVIVFQILDRNEIEIDYERQTKFIDLENGEVLVTEPWLIREKYKKVFLNYLQELKLACRQNHIDYVLLNTHTPLDKALFEYLKKRKLLM